MSILELIFISLRILLRPISDLKHNELGHSPLVSHQSPQNDKISSRKASKSSSIAPIGDLHHVNHVDQPLINHNLPPKPDHPPRQHSRTSSRVSEAPKLAENESSDEVVTFRDPESPQNDVADAPVEFGEGNDKPIRFLNMDPQMPTIPLEKRPDIVEYPKNPTVSKN